MQYVEKSKDLNECQISFMHAILSIKGSIIKSKNRIFLLSN